MINKYIPIIGLEVHVELKTKSKMFCGCSADYFGHVPNSHCCPVCLGLPGALPVPNRQAVEWCLMVGMALNCKVNEESYFERKNYFYPDLPKGYQISQYSKPLSIQGWIEIQTSRLSDKDTNKVGKKIRINRVHQEEDTGKLTHTEIAGERYSLVDFNRSGVPLVEIVTEPDFRSTEEVVSYLKKLHQLIRYLGVSDADMEKGTMRIEPTINLKITKEGKTFYTPLVEIKNINSFRFVKQALEYEIKRQTLEFERTGTEKTTGNKITVGFNEDKKITFLQRNKEEANDYRYFPEPDIPMIKWTKDQISKLKDQIPELPDEKIARFMRDYKLSEYDAMILTEVKETAQYFAESIKYQGSSIGYQKITPKVIANWIINKRADITKNSPEELVKLIFQKIQTVNMDEKVIGEIVKRVIAANEKAAADYRSGKEQSLMFLLGQVMRETKGQARADRVKKLLLTFLNK